MKRQISHIFLAVALLSAMGTALGIDCQALHDAKQAALWAYKDAQAAGKTWAEMAPLQATYSDLKARWSDDYYRQTCQSVTIIPYYRDVRGY